MVGGTEVIDIAHVENRNNDIEESQAAIDRARAELDFEPTVSIEDVMRDSLSGSY